MNFKCVDTIDLEGKTTFTVLKVNDDLQYEVDFIEIKKENVNLTGGDLALLRSTCEAKVEFINLENISHRVYKADGIVIQ